MVFAQPKAMQEVELLQLGANIDAWSYEVIFFAGASATDLEILS